MVKSYGGTFGKKLAKLYRHLHYHLAISLVEICPGDILAKYEKTFVQSISILFLMEI